MDKLIYSHPLASIVLAGVTLIVLATIGAFRMVGPTQRVPRPGQWK